MTKKIELFKSKNHFFLAALFSGILVGTSYIPYPAWATFFCYIPLWYAALEAEKQNYSLKFIFILGWITQFVLTLIGFHWLYYTSTVFGQLPPVISALALVLFASFMHIYIPLSLILAVWVKRQRNLSTSAFIFLLSVSLILLERIWPSIFEWNLGYTLLWMKWPWFQWADTVGFWGLSSFLLFIQSLILYLATICISQQRKAALGLSLLLVTLIGLHFGGLSKEKKWSKFDTVFNVLVVQGNISNEEKLASEKGSDFQPFVLQTYVDLVNSHLNTQTQKPDAILWPETAMPFALDSNFSIYRNQKQLQDHINAWNTVVITGGYSQDLKSKDHLGHFKVKNSIFFLGPNSSTSQPSPYFKTDLLVFGEYMPFGQTFPILYKWLPFVGVYEKGPGPVLKTIRTPDNKEFLLGPQICYESLNSPFARGLSNIGTDIIINSTNDSWYGADTEPYQHLFMTLARGVEVRRPLVRATNTGFSSAILANGQVLAKSPMDAPWAHTFKIDYKKNAESSFYTRYGYLDYLIWIFLFLFIFLKGQNARHQKS